MMTRPVTTPSAREEVAGLPAEVRARVLEHADDAASAVTDWLTVQDRALGTRWTSVWTEHVADAFEIVVEAMPRKAGN